MNSDSKITEVAAREVVKRLGQVIHGININIGSSVDFVVRICSVVEEVSTMPEFRKVLKGDLKAQVVASVAEEFLGKAYEVGVVNSDMRDRIANIISNGDEIYRVIDSIIDIAKHPEILQIEKSIAKCLNFC